ncbi:MAG: hypothetical protein HQL27_08465 [Candidatus Omnitrophica bacterium]|nr:hypothetical protein [Candidatus Omnitrophota bacterium]
MSYLAKKRLTVKIASLAVLVSFIFTSVIPSVFAQTMVLPTPGMPVSLSAPFLPVMLKGMTLYPDNPLRFDFIVDGGNTGFTPSEIKQESGRLVKYFLAAMTVPQNDLWVNLSPYESNRIIPEALGKTELGRDMLAQDYILKQLTASLLDPEKDLGKEFWNRVYKKAQEKLGTAEVPVDTFNKVWIMPDQATVYENGNAVYVVKSSLKIMLDQDYQAMHEKKGSTTYADKGSSAISAQITREIILPEIEKEVNEGRNFALIRQIYQSLILAQWYKETIKESLLSKVYIDKKKIAGVNLSDPTIKDQIYARYIESFKKGVINIIKEDYDQIRGQVLPRKYFSGGEVFGKIKITRVKDAGQIAGSPTGNEYKLAMVLDPKRNVAGNTDLPGKAPLPAIMSTYPQ